MLEVRLLGQFEVRLNGEPVLLPSRPAQSLLAYLTLTAGTAHRREKLAALLWPDADDDNARSNLRHALWRIRKGLEAQLPADRQYLSADDLSVAFAPTTPYRVDAVVLEGSANGSRTTEELKDALAAYKGELLPGFYEEWVLRERERLEALFERKVDDLLDHLVAERRWPEVLEWAEHWIAVGHAPEPAYRALMLAHNERGDRARLASVYERCRQALFEELGAQPSDLTRTLFDRLSRGERVLPITGKTAAQALDEEPAGLGEPPFKGLQFFDEADAAWFFGREALIFRLVERLRSERFLALIGASGSGKSSVVRAGLVPAVRRTTPDASSACVVYVVTPTTHPLESFAAMLTRTGMPSATSVLEDMTRDPRGLRLHLQKRMPSGTRALLVVDQFEELFTLCHDAFEREVFVDNLLAASEADGVSIVIALRADFYAHCAQHPDLRSAVADHQEYLGLMGPDELRRAIEGPAEGGAWTFDPGLVDLIIRDVGDEPGALPLLSHALLETWRRRQARRMTLAGYAQAGGVRGAIAKTAETVFSERLTSAQQLIARRLFLRLTELGDGTQDTRRRAAVTELVGNAYEEQTVRAVLYELANARLITLGEQSVEVAHEALIRAWPSLRGWLDEDRHGLRLQRQMTHAAQEWERLAHDSGLLYRGLRLAQARDWATNHPDDLNSLERTFLEASDEAAELEAVERDASRQRELDAAKSIAETERRTARQLRQRAVFLALAFILALAMASLALFFGDQARQSALTAEANARTASSRELAAAAIANLNVDPERSLLLGLEAVRGTYVVDGTWTADAEGALHRALLDSRVQLTLNGHTGAVLSAVFSPDGRRLATASRDGTARVWDASSGRELLSLRGHSGQVNGAVFSHDARRVATAGDDRTVRLWDADTGQALLTISGHTGPVKQVVFSPDDRRLATASTDGTARVWDASFGLPLLTLSGHQDGVNSVAFSQDGLRLATGGDDKTARVWDAFTGEHVLTLRGHAGGILAVAYSPDGRRIATASGASTDNTARVWNANTGQQLLSLSDHMNTVQSVVFSPDGARVATASLDGTAKVWDVSTGRGLFTLFGHSRWVLSVAFSPDGRRLVTSSLDGTARVWDAGPSKELLVFSGHTARPWRVAFSPDGMRAVSASLDRTARIWDPTTGGEFLTLAGHTDRVHNVAFSPDGRRVVTASEDNTARVWDAMTGEEQLTLVGHGQGLVGGLFGGVLAAAFSPDGSRIATAGADKMVMMWDATTGHAERVLAGHTAGLTALAFSRDGTRLATGGDDNTARVWDFASGQELHTLRGHTQRIWGVDFSPDGSRLATASADSSVRVWDVASGLELLSLTGHTGTVNTAVFTPDGLRVVSAGRDATIKVWDATTGRILLTLSGDVPGYTGLALSPDGTRVAAVADDAIRLYVLPIEDLISLARTRVTRTLTPEECLDFLHLTACPAPRLPN